MSYSTISIHVLGGFKLFFEGTETDPVAMKRCRALLTFLALNCDQAPTRQQVAVLFWPDSGESQARTNLRQLLHHIRQTYPRIEDYLEIGSTNLKWRPDIKVSTDVYEFEQNLAQAQEAASSKDATTETNMLERALGLYQGDLLPECYDEWIEDERSRLRQLFCNTLGTTTHLLEKQGHYHRALRYAERHLALDDLNEAIYRQLMVLYSQVGERSRVVKCYQKCLTVLDKALGIEPETETRQVYTRLTIEKKVVPSKTDQQEDIPLIGREKQWSVARDLWQQVTEGTTQVLLISGEAGIGKTRLAQNLLKFVEQQGYTTATACCSGVEGHLAYAPVSQWLRSQPMYSQLKKLPVVWKSEISRLLPELLEEESSLASPGPLSESWQRQRFFKALAHAVAVCEQPLLLFLDDLHWCDLETLEWVHYLLHHEAAGKVLIIGTFRSEEYSANGSLISFILDLRRSNRCTEMTLNALDANETAELAGHLTRKELNSEAATAIYEDSEGNPLFIVEMARAQLESSGDMSLGATSYRGVLPKRVQAVIEMRLSCLSSSTVALLEVAALIGRNFNYNLLVQASQEPQEVVVEKLDDLCDRKLLKEQENSYAFSHDKIREVVLSHISIARSRLCHGRIADALSLVSEKPFDHQSARLAYHYENACLLEKAISCYIGAGRVAKQMYANRIAEAHFQRAYSLVCRHLHGKDRERHELEVKLHLSTCLVQGRGYGAQEVLHSGLRVLELCEKLDEQPEPPLLRMLAISNLVAGKIRKAEELGVQLLNHAEVADNDVVRVEAHYVLGVSYHWLGRFSMAEKHLEAALALYNHDNLHTHTMEYAQDPATVCSIRLALVLWHLDQPRQAERIGLQSIDIAEKTGHPFSRSYALHWFSWLQNLRGDISRTLHYAKASIACAEHYGYQYFSTQSTILYGWAMAKGGEIEEGIQKMREGLSCFRATGSEIGCSYYRAMIAEVLASSGQLEQSHILLNEALQDLAKTEEQWAAKLIFEIQRKIQSPGS